MKVTVLRFRIEDIVLPALLILAGDRFPWFQVLSEIKSFSRGEILPSSRSQVFKADSMVFVVVQPIKDLFDHLGGCVKAPRKDHVLELIKVDEA